MPTRIAAFWTNLCTVRTVSLSAPFSDLKRGPFLPSGEMPLQIVKRSREADSPDRTQIGPKSRDARRHLRCFTAYPQALFCDTSVGERSPSEGGTGTAGARKHSCDPEVSVHHSRTDEEKLSGTSSESTRAVTKIEKQERKLLQWTHRKNLSKQGRKL